MKIYYTSFDLKYKKKITNYYLVDAWIRKKIEDQYLEISMTPLVLNDVLLDNYV
jgi:hypothetical protein